MNKPLPDRSSVQKKPHRCGFVHHYCRVSLRRYGRLVAKHPLPFILLPVIVAGLLGIGLVRLESNTDIEHLFTPTNGEAKTERRHARTLFPANDSVSFTSIRQLTLGTYGRVIIAGKGTELANATGEVLRLDAVVRNITVADGQGKTFSFSDLCAVWEGNCTEDPLLTFIRLNRTKYETLDFEYPVTNSNLFLGRSMSSPKPGSVSALSLTYWLQDTPVSEEWEKSFIDEINKYQTSLITVVPFTSESLEDELAANSRSIVPRFSVAFTLLITFAVTSLVMLDWVRTKPLIGMLGVLSPALAILASFGLLSAAGVEFSNVVGTVPFLVLSIGVDDMFIIVQAYRQTSPRLSVPERISETTLDAGMAITITSITDLLAFGVGAITVFPAVFDFCVYAALAVFVDYLFQITFFLGCLSLDARREEANRHGVTFQVVLPKACSEEKSQTYRVFCSGGVKNDERLIGDEEEHLPTRLIREWYGKWLVNPYVKAVLLLLFCGYLGVSIYGCTLVTEGLELKNLVRDDSYAADFLSKDNKYFDEYGPQVQFIFQESVDYWDLSVQADIGDLIKRITSTEYAGSPPIVTFWLNDFVKYVLTPNGLDNQSIPQFLFMQLLNSTFLSIPQFQNHGLDLKFSSNSQQISASRFFVQTANLTNANLERQMMTSWRSIAKENRMIVYHPAFIFFDQYTAVLPNTLQNIGIALAAMLVVSLIFIPRPWAAALIIWSIVSIDVGVVGLMTFWGVNLDSISMINIILCIGFSVDFSAHICYAFVTSERKTRKEKTADALGKVGFPVMQGALSTVVGTIPLAFSPSYLFRTFFKTLFLVIVFGFLHGFVLLPGLLSTVGPLETNAGSTQINDGEEQKKE